MSSSSRATVADSYRVYVIELDEAVWAKTKMKRRNPAPDLTKPCLYVGHSGLSPKRRFAQHKKGGLGTSTDVHQHGRYLRKSLYKHAPVTHTRTEAEQVEADWANELRSQGYRVWEGRLGALDLKRRLPS